ncbi:hypothetical protein ACOMHN_010609 [Nucella lapillus]
MKAYLKAQDGSAVSLGPRVTTVGREGCDLTIQAVGVDYQHAVIEFCEAEECLVLQDLNTAQGTYVNEVRVQNAAVRLAPGDRIRFGYNGLPYEVQLEQPSGVTCPPVQQKQQAWNRELTILNESPVYSATQNQHALPQHQQQLYGQQQQQQPQAGPQQALPFLLSSGVGQSAVWTQPTPQAPLPRPPLRSRPLSAGSGSGSTRRSTFDIPRSFHPGSNSVVVGGTPSSVRQADPDTDARSSQPHHAEAGAQRPNERDRKLAQQLERVKKDKSITSGLVTQMQRDMSNKDSTISKLTREIEVLKKDLRERDKLLSNANIKEEKSE